MVFHPQPIKHGGRLDEAIALHGGNRADWLDLSTGINPQGFSVGAIEPTHWQRLPEEQALGELLKAARKFYRVGGNSELVAGNGSQAIIEALPFVLAKDKAPLNVAIVSPAYGEHEHCWRKHGKHTVNRIADLGEIRDQNVVVVVNPNNPTGRVFPTEELLSAAQKLHQNKGVLVVDEAFGDISPEASLLGDLPDNGIILKSIGKFFGLAGIRLGFAIGSAEICSHLRNHLGPWNISAPTLEVGKQALSDAAWIARTRQFLASHGTRHSEVLQSAGLSIIGDAKLFCSVSHPRANSIYQHLLVQKILVRAFDENQQMLRFGLTSNEEELLRLKTALDEIMMQVNGNG